MIIQMTLTYQHIVTIVVTYTQNTHHISAPRTSIGREGYNDTVKSNNKMEGKMYVWNPVKDNKCSREREGGGLGNHS